MLGLFLFLKLIFYFLKIRKIEKMWRIILKINKRGKTQKKHTFFKIIIIAFRYHQNNIFCVSEKGLITILKTKIKQTLAFSIFSLEKNLFLTNNVPFHIFILSLIDITIIL